MSTASVRVVRSVSVTCHSADLATRHTTSVLAASMSASTGSVSARPPALRVEPNATRVAVFELEVAGGGPAEELVVLGVGSRPSPFDVLHAEMVELLGDPELVVDGERQAFLLAAVAQGGVVDVDRVGQLGGTWWLAGPAAMGRGAWAPPGRRAVGSDQPTYSTQSL